MALWKSNDLLQSQGSINALLTPIVWQDIHSWKLCVGTHNSKNFEIPLFDKKKQQSVSQYSYIVNTFPLYDYNVDFEDADKKPKTRKKML